MKQLVLFFLLGLCRLIAIGQTIKLVEPTTMKCNEPFQQVKMKIEACENIDQAEKILLDFCVQKDNTIRYVLTCKTCGPKDKMRFFPRAFFKAYPSTLNNLSSKGQLKFYTLLQLKSFLSDRLVAFDSLNLDLSDMIIADRQNALSLYLKNTTTGQLIYPIKNNKETISFFQNSFFAGDTAVSVCYKKNNSEVILTENLRLHFLSVKEKEELTENVLNLKKADEQMSGEDIGKYMQGLIEATYTKVDIEGLKRWISKVKY